MPNSRNHKIEKLPNGRYRLQWTFDTRGAEGRTYTRCGRRDTDYSGAHYFSHKWGCPLPEDEKGGV